MPYRTVEDLFHSDNYTYIVKALHLQRLTNSINKTKRGTHNSYIANNYCCISF